MTEETEPKVYKKKTEMMKCSEYWMDFNNCVVPLKAKYGADVVYKAMRELSIHEYQVKFKLI